MNVYFCSDLVYIIFGFLYFLLLSIAVKELHADIYNSVEKFYPFLLIFSPADQINKNNNHACTNKGHSIFLIDG